MSFCHAVKAYRFSFLKELCDDFVILIKPVLMHSLLWSEHLLQCLLHCYFKLVPTVELRFQTEICGCSARHPDQLQIVREDQDASASVC